MNITAGEIAVRDGICKKMPFFPPEFVPTSATTNFHAALFITVLSSAGIAVVCVSARNSRAKQHEDEDIVREACDDKAPGEISSLWDSSDATVSRAAAQGETLTDTMKR